MEQKNNTFTSEELSFPVDGILLFAGESEKQVRVSELSWKEMLQ